MLTWPASNFRNPGENTWNYSRCVCVLRTPNQKWRGLFVTSNIFRNRLPCKNLKFWRPNIEITIRHLMCGLIEITCLEWWKSQKQSECSVLQFLLGSLSTRSLRVCDTEQERSQGRSCFFFFLLMIVCVCSFHMPVLDLSVFRVNVCGGQCCHGWSKAQGSQRCTKRKFPRKQNCLYVNTTAYTHTPYQSGQSKVFKVFLVWCSHGTRQ